MVCVIIVGTVGDDHIRSVIADIADEPAAGFQIGNDGTVIDIQDDTVIVEFGNNRNCRIPMQKAAVAMVEKPEDAQ